MTVMCVPAQDGILRYISSRVRAEPSAQTPLTPAQFIAISTVVGQIARIEFAEHVFNALQVLLGPVCG